LPSDNRSSLSNKANVDVDGWWILAMTMIEFALATFFKYNMTSWLAAESNPLVGSSRNKIFGHVMSELAMPTRRFWPPLRPFRMGVPMMVFA